mgnify:CR=1 FL=1
MQGGGEGGGVRPRGHSATRLGPTLRAQGWSFPNYQYEYLDTKGLLPDTWVLTWVHLYPSTYFEYRLRQTVSNRTNSRAVCKPIGAIEHRENSRFVVQTSHGHARRCRMLTHEGMIVQAARNPPKATVQKARRGGLLSFG